MMKFRTASTVGITFFPCFVYADGQDWMMSIDNLGLFIQLLLVYSVIAFVVFQLLRKTTMHKVKIWLFAFATLVVTGIHWEMAKQRSIKDPFKNLSTEYIDTTKIDVPN